MQDYSWDDIDQRIELLTMYERRCVINFLHKSEGRQVEIDDVVNHLQRQPQLPDEHRQIRVKLYHIHLPKLDMTNILDYDSKSETVQYHGDVLVESLLESIPENPVPVN